VARLWRPYIPLIVRCRVVLRQLGELWINDCLNWHHRNLSGLLKDRLGKLADLLGCTIKDLHLDHDPPLAARERGGQGKWTVYRPAANDPEYLVYRPKVEHQIKTNVRGEHGQYPDRVLIKRERKRVEQKTAKRQSKYNQKYNWPKRKLRSASRWPKKGRKVR
jgi:hypothetical protein